MSEQFFTFEEFKRRRESYLGLSDSEDFGLIDRGSQVLKKQVKRHIYEIEGYRCNSLEEVERVAAAQGIPLRALDYRAMVQPLGAGKCDILIRFVSKTTREARDAR